jgi:hypothetical protein
MALDVAMELQEAAISSETAISCLLLLNARCGARVDTENARAGLLAGLTGTQRFTGVGSN